MIRLTPIHRTALVSLALLTCVAATYAGIYWWLGVERASLTELRTRVGASAQTHALIQSQQVLAQETADERKELTGYLLAVDDPAGFLELLESMGQDSGVALEIRSVTNEHTTRAPDVTETGTARLPQEYVRVELEAAGSWSAVYRLLRLVELMPYAVTVERTALSRDTAGAQAAWKQVLELRVETRVR